MSDNIYYVYYQKGNNEYIVYDPWNNKIVETDYNGIYNFKKTYEIMKGFDQYEDMEENLKQYYVAFKKWNLELYNYGKNGIDAYTYSYNNNLHVINTFLKISKFDLKNQPLIDHIESHYFEGCHNGALEYCSEGTYECYGYDQSSFYGRLLAEYSLKIPINKGKEIKLNSLDKRNLKFGFYCVRIECDNDNFKKIFQFSKDNIYTHYSLFTAFMYQKEFNVKINLLDLEFNAYIYDDDDLIESKSIFGEWFQRLIKVKKQYPKNQLAKYLITELWGRLSQKNKPKTIETNIDEIDRFKCNYKENLCEDDDYVIHEQYDDKFILQENIPIYKYNIRLKPFLISYGRFIMGNLAFDTGLNNIVRIMCDNITYKIPLDKPIENFTLEQKTTGLICFESARTYFHVCSKCNEKFKYVDFVKHSC